MPLRLSRLHPVLVASDPASPGFLSLPLSSPLWFCLSALWATFLTSGPGLRFRLIFVFLNCLHHTTGSFSLSRGLTLNLCIFSKLVLTPKIPAFCGIMAGRGGSVLSLWGGSKQPPVWSPEAVPISFPRSGPRRASGYWLLAAGPCLSPPRQRRPRRRRSPTDRLSRPKSTD